MFTSKKLCLNFLVLNLSVIFLIACSKHDYSDRIEEVLRSNPEMVLKAIEDNPIDFIQAIQQAADYSRDELLKRQVKEERKRVRYYINNPIKPRLRGDEGHIGYFNSGVQIVVFSDFQCPYSARGFENIQKLMGQSDVGDITYILKHNPLNFHSEALIAAKYFEAIRLKSNDKAISFHNYLFNNHDGFRRGRAFLSEAVEHVGLTVYVVEELIDKNPKIYQRVREDIQEAKDFGFDGTPVFVVNGVVLEGARDVDHYAKIIEKLREHKKSGPSTQISQN